MELKYAWILGLFIYLRQFIINNVILEGRNNYLPTPPRKQRMKSITTQAMTSTLRSLSTLLRLYLGPLLFIRALLSWPNNNNHTCYVCEMWCWWPNSLCTGLISLVLHTGTGHCVVFWIQTLTMPFFMITQMYKMGKL